MRLRNRAFIERCMSLYFIAIALGTMANQLKHMLEATGPKRGIYITYNGSGEYTFEVILLIIAFVCFVYLTLRNYGLFEKKHTIQ
jgi:hypothetical protein